MRIHVSAGPFQQYWFPATHGLGIGVTACTVIEAELMARSAISLLPPGSLLTGEVVENVNLRELDARPVLPCCGPPSMHGVWYPYGG